MSSCCICLSDILCSQMEGYLCINSYTKTNRNCIDKVLHRVYQRQCRHCLLADLCHKETVHNIVQ